MNKSNTKLFTDVEALLEQSVVAEAGAKVWKQFEQALSMLDETSAELLLDHFRGASAQKISRDRELSLAEVEACLTKAKRELIHHLRSGFQVRQ